MIRRLAASAAAVSLCLAGCNPSDAPPETSAAAPQAQAEAPLAQPDQSPDAPAAQDNAASAVAVTAPAAPAAPGAPAFAVLYPGATPDGAPTTATSEAGDGGLVTFHTDAAPDAVVAFYRDKAEAAGLRSVMGLNQGDARAYGAADDHAEGARLQVVAAPGDEGLTSVQLSWSEGQ